MTDLLKRIVAEGLPVSAFPIHEYWVDIGMTDDLRRAREDARKEADKGGETP
jgi:NDP-sugar pyrophosphorylase family protein